MVLSIKNIRKVVRPRPIGMARASFSVILKSLDSSVRSEKPNRNISMNMLLAYFLMGNTMKGSGFDTG